ncbi:MAG: head GIN domain-containing protein [Bacteroidia bacterium]|nr:head GIN domain-containing protein [Bacteroidia bacterium]
MKTKTFILSTTIFLLTLSVTACAQSKKTISRNYDISSFNAISADIVGNVIFTQSSTTSVSAEGEEEMVNNLIIKVENNTLKLSKKKNLKRIFGNRKATRLVVKISSPNLNRIESDGVGNITLNGVVKTDNLYIKSDGVGNISASQLECRQLTIDSDGVGNTRLKGKGQFAEYKSDGVGNIDTREYIAEDVIVKLSGVGSIKCYASKNIELSGSGVGSITYYGNPNIKALNKSGIGKISSGD